MTEEKGPVEDALDAEDKNVDESELPDPDTESAEEDDTEEDEEED
jgi:hypothetical protein